MGSSVTVLLHDFNLVKGVASVSSGLSLSMGFASFLLETGSTLKTWTAGDFFYICFLILAALHLHRCVQAFLVARGQLLSSRGVRAFAYAGLCLQSMGSST